jgi:hypothetical protein
VKQNVRQTAGSICTILRWPAHVLSSVVTSLFLPTFPCTASQWLVPINAGGPILGKRAILEGLIVAGADDRGLVADAVMLML